MPKSDEPFTVPTSNTWEKYAEDFSDGEDNTTVAPAATMPTTFKEAHRTAEDSLNSIIKQLCENEMAHQRHLDECFNIYSSDEQELRHKFESRQSTFLIDIEAKMRQVELALTSTADKMVSVATKFLTIDATLTRVEESTTKMSGLLETNRAQLQQLQDNKTARVAAMQEHHNQLDNMDAVLSCVYDNVMKSVNLAQEVDSKISASCQMASVDNQHPPAPGLISPPRPSETDTTQPPPDDSVPDTNTTMGGSPVARLVAPHRFANVSLIPRALLANGPHLIHRAIAHHPSPRDYPMPVRVRPTLSTPPITALMIHAQRR